MLPWQISINLKFKICLPSRFYPWNLCAFDVPTALKALEMACISGRVVEYIVPIDVIRVRFPDPFQVSWITILGFWKHARSFHQFLNVIDMNFGGAEISSSQLGKVHMDMSHEPMLRNALSGISTNPTSSCVPCFKLGAKVGMH